MRAVPLVVIGLIVAALFIIPKVVFFVATSLILFFILMVNQHIRPYQWSWYAGTMAVLGAFAFYHEVLGYAGIVVFALSMGVAGISHARYKMLRTKLHRKTASRLKV